MFSSVLLRGASEPGRRAITLPTLLDTVRRDPGMTAVYYANRYFGKERIMEVTRVLWGELKFHGQVTVDRIDGPEEPPRWYPVFSVPRKLHRIRRHCAEEEDLSVLQHSDLTSDSAAPASGDNDASASFAAAVEDNIINLVHSIPGRNIQFYISELPTSMQPYGPMAFKRLRQAEVIIREQTPQGTFVWK
ncbi:uncharacterized protein TEOVI_000164300 [Trypanosoma equiperdum]|uniref:Uncharacterized protein n=1 Tax=Trypanosoma equiperdum TaxID=5694 RepID=A0A1G4ICK3_TRYEQ|nr:hypothetical protein, conserved [Trypanosoma equiperdum]